MGTVFGKNIPIFDDEVEDTLNVFAMTSDQVGLGV